MGVKIHFGEYFDENTTIAEIYENFSKEDNNPFKKIKDFCSSDANAAMLCATVAFFAGVHVNDSDSAAACGYAGKSGAWAANVYNGCFGSSREFVAHPDISAWRQHIRDLMDQIIANKDTYTAGDVYRLIETDALWKNNYVGVGNQKVYDLEVVRNNILRFVEDPKKYKKEKQSGEKEIDTTAKMGQVQNFNVDTGKELPTDPIQRKLIELIQNKQYQIVLTGAPGTGKTYSAKKVAEWFQEESADAHMIETVQFHPSYDYTDFVEGLRPVEEETQNEKGDTVKQMHFRRVDGSFMRFCRYVAWQNEVKEKEERQPDQDVDDAEPVVKNKPLYFFIIDEINRADLSKVFGELMFAMEGDKRGEPVSTQYSNLETYFNEEERKRDSYYRTCFESTDDPGFFIPENVVIIGTMNDIDRSVESMDFAMRRRFAWLDVVVDRPLLQSAFRSGNFGKTVEKNADSLAKRVVEFNKVLHDPRKYGLSTDYGLNTDYDISQGQFGGLKNLEFKTVESLMDWVWNYRVKLLLKEYLRGRVEDVEKELKKLGKVWNGMQPEAVEEQTEGTADTESEPADKGTV